MTLQGKGYFTFILPECEGGDPGGILAAAQAAGLSHVLVKIADGVKAFGVSPAGEDYTAPVVQALRGAGIAVWGWHYVYGDKPAAEATIAIQRTQALNLDGYVVDAEVEYKQPGKEKAARQFMSAVREVLTVPIALSSFRFPNYHPELPWGAFLEKCDLHMPQVYWEQAHNAGGQLRESKRQCDALPNAKPYIATGPAYGTSTGWAPSPAEVKDFLTTARSLNIPAVNFFSWDYCRRKLPQLWEAVAAFDWTVPPQIISSGVSQPEQPEEPATSETGGTPVQPAGMTPPAEATPAGKPPAGTQPPAGTTPAAPPDTFAVQYLTALNSRQAGKIAALYDSNAIHVRGDNVLRGKAAIQGDYTAFFAALPEGTSFNLSRAEANDDVRFLTWKTGKRTGQATIVLRKGKIILDFTFLG